MTQGTIFSCAVAGDYVGCPTYGLIVTARCDVAHDKARVLNYLPVVSLDDWLHRDGRIILSERLLSDAKGAMEKALKAAGFSPVILETEAPTAVLNTLFPAGGDKKLRANFQKGCTRFTLSSQCLKSAPSEKLCLELAREAPGLRDAVISELVHHKLAGFYFLPAIEPKGPDLGFVVLAREIQMIPRDLAIAVADGLEAALYENMCNSTPAFQNKLSITMDDFAYPVGQLQSPQLEHLLQTFAFLFGRIGLPDPDKSYVDGLWTRQPTVSTWP